VQDKVAVITGAGRGQGRSHAVHLAANGAAIVAIDRCADVPSAPYPMSTAADLAETARLVEEVGGRVVTAEADVRDRAGMVTAVENGIAEFGRLDIVVANAGIGSFTPAHRLREEHWRETIDINLTGAWFTVQACLAGLRAAGGGSIILTSSVAGIRGYANGVHYAASKHGLVGVMHALANELAPDGIRVNTVHPTSVETPMLTNESALRLFDPAGTGSDTTAMQDALRRLNAMPVPWVDPEDVSNAVLFLASDEARYVTGLCMTVDAGACIRTAT
jgi:SDR family mycofactocin-dependent oxidoreductase